MFNLFRRWREDRLIRRMAFTEAEWETAVADWPVAQRYQGEERVALRDMSFRFLARKTIAAGGGFAYTDAMCLKLATMACVPVLHLGLDWYDRWQTVILYEGDFVPHGTWYTADGVAHERAPGLSGEAWLRGPVILSWDSICMSGPGDEDHYAANVVIHELAHKLDMLRDGANGAPPLHPDMAAGEWHRVFTAAWERLEVAEARNQTLPVDDYALTNPAEFFAVCSETFFEAPLRLKKGMPDVYRLLTQFYRQQPVPLAKAGL